MQCLSVNAAAAADDDGDDECIIIARKLRRTKELALRISRYTDWTTCRSSYPFNAIVKVSDLLKLV